MPAGPSDLERVFQEERGRVVATLIRLFGDIDVAEEAVQEAFLVAARRWPDRRPAAEPGWLDPHHGPQQGHRPLPARIVAPRPPAGGAPSPRPRRRPDRGGGTRARRPAAPHLHLLPPGPRPRGAGGPHAPSARRPRHRGHRPLVPRPRGHHGATPRPGEEEDPRRQHPVPGPRRRRASRPAADRPGRALPRLQRGLRGRRGGRPQPRRPLRRGHPPRPAPGRADARRARGARPARPAAAHRLPPPGAHRGRRLAGAAGRPGPHSVGRRAGRRGPSHRGGLRAARPARPLPAPGDDPGRAQRSARARRRRTGPRSCASTTSSCSGRRRRSSR